MPKMRGTQADFQIGQRIKQAREKQKLSLAEVAARIGISAQMLFCYETGASRLYISRLVQIARALDLKVSFFTRELEREERLTRTTI